jgi:hypothetical protein
MMTPRPRNLILAFALGAMLLVGMYIHFYQFSTLPAEHNALILNLISLVAPLSSAIFATMVFLSFDRADKPRQVWKFMTIFVWVWTVAEFIWTITLMQTDDVPLPSLADAFWLSGFIFLTIALHKQYQIVTKKTVAAWKILVIWAGVFVLALFVTIVAQVELNVGNYLEYFYAVADFAAGIVAIRIFIAFRGGLMSRPWIGLFVLGLSDALYAWLIASDMYATSAESGDPISMLADTSYMAAYLVLGIGFYATYLTIKHGPGNFVETTKA